MEVCVLFISVIQWVGFWDVTKKIFLPSEKYPVVGVSVTDYTLSQVCLLTAAH